jgi:hypothetical protein
VHSCTQVKCASLFSWPAGPGGLAVHHRPSLTDASRHPPNLVHERDIGRACCGEDIPSVIDATGMNQLAGLIPPAVSTLPGIASTGRSSARSATSPARPIVHRSSPAEDVPDGKRRLHVACPAADTTKARTQVIFFIAIGHDRLQIVRETENVGWPRSLENHA